MSENSSEMSERDSRMARASSALTACTAVNPASSTISTARIRNTISSSTTRTFVADVEDVIDPEDMGLGLSFPGAMSRCHLLGVPRYSRTDGYHHAPLPNGCVITVCRGGRRASRPSHVHNPHDPNV